MELVENIIQFRYDEVKISALNCIADYFGWLDHTKFRTRTLYSSDLAFKLVRDLNRVDDLNPSISFNWEGEFIPTIEYEVPFSYSPWLGIELNQKFPGHDFSNPDSMVKFAVNYYIQTFMDYLHGNLGNNISMLSKSNVRLRVMSNSGNPKLLDFLNSIDNLSTGEYISFNGIGTEYHNWDFQKCFREIPKNKEIQLKRVK